MKKTNDTMVLTALKYTVLAGLMAMGTTVTHAADAPSGQPVPPPSSQPAPPPPAMVSDQEAAKASPHPVTNEEQKPANLGDPELEPEVTIVERGDERHEEVRVNGVIRYVKVTPKVGPPYYLIPYNDGTYIRRESLDSTFRGPMWQIYSW